MGRGEGVTSATCCNEARQKQAFDPIRTTVIRRHEPINGCDVMDFPQTEVSMHA
jgi:hypothetical protein